MVLSNVSLSLKFTCCLFLLNCKELPPPILYMNKKASNLSNWEQIWRPFQKLNILKTFIFLIYNNWHFSEWTSLYVRRLYNSFASLNLINTGPSNENAAYWLMNVVCWLAYKMVYLGKYLSIYKPQVIPAMKKISKIVYSRCWLTKKEKK